MLSGPLLWKQMPMWVTTGLHWARPYMTYSFLIGTAMRYFLRLLWPYFDADSVIFWTTKCGLEVIHRHPRIFKLFLASFSDINLQPRIKICNKVISQGNKQSRVWFRIRKGRNACVTMRTCGVKSQQFDMVVYFVLAHRQNSVLQNIAPFAIVRCNWESFMGR